MTPVYERLKYASKVHSWIRDVLNDVDKGDCIQPSVELFDKVVVDGHPWDRVQLYAATVMFIITKVKYTRGAHLWSTDLVEYGCGTFSREDLLRAEIFIIRNLIWDNSISTLIFA